MKKNKLQKIFLEEMEKTTNISAICKKIGISRKSIYEWMQEDSFFKNEVENAKLMGRDSLYDVGLNTVTKSAVEGNLKAGIYLMDHFGYKLSESPPKDRLTKNIVVFTAMDGSDPEHKNDEIMEFGVGPA